MLTPLEFRHAAHTRCGSRAPSNKRSGREVPRTNARGSYEMSAEEKNKERVHHHRDAGLVAEVSGTVGEDKADEDDLAQAGDRQYKLGGSMGGTPRK